MGGRFRISGERWHTVIGVVEDVLAHGTASQPEHGQLYFPADEGGSRTLVIRVDRPEALFPQLRSVVTETNADVPVNTLSMVSDRYRAGLAKERLLAFLLSAFALSAGLLAAVGLFGVASQVAQRRTREFGIRMSLGAERGSIFATVLGSAAVTIGAGLATGVAMTLVGLRLLRSGVAGLESADPLAYLVAGVLLASVTLLATSAPARRAARIDPVEALRSE